MKPKDRIFPTLDERYELQLQMVCEPSPQRRESRSGAERHSALRAELIDLTGRVCKPTTTLH